MVAGMRFEARELKPYGDFVRTPTLVEGRVYFRVSFLDQDMMIPEVVPLVFIGRHLHAEQPGLYFQVAASYLAGERVELGSGRLTEGDAPGTSPSAGQPWCEVMQDGEFAHVYEFEPALESLLACSLRRREWNGVVRPCPPAPE